MAMETGIRNSLLDLARSRGDRLSVEQLGNVLPVEEMTPTEIAELVAELEEAGVHVDLEDRRLAARAIPQTEAQRTAGVVTIGAPAAPAISAPGVQPSRHGFLDDGPEPAAYRQDGYAQVKGAPVILYDGMEMLPLISMVGVAIVLLILLG